MGWVKILSKEEADRAKEGLEWLQAYSDGEELEWEWENYTMENGHPSSRWFDIVSLNYLLCAIHDGKKLRKKERPKVSRYYVNEYNLDGKIRLGAIYSTEKMAKLHENKEEGKTMLRIQIVNHADGRIERTIEEVK